MSASREAYLGAMGIPVWRRRVRRADSVAPAPVGGESEAAARPREASAASVETSTPADALDVARLDWDRLAQVVSTCTACALHATRTQAVFGVGSREADLLVIGEAPGADEDRQGEPFVGRAGRLLNAMLRAIGFERADVYIANILKCRPPNNRDPQPAEALACTPFLERQIALIEPKVILAVGRVSAQWLLQSDRPIGTLRGRIYRYGTSEVPLVVTYHPAYLLRSPEAKAKAWQDLCLVKSTLDASE